MDIYSQLASRIIKAQEGVVGPVALEQANKVEGIRLGKSAEEVKIEGNKKEVVEKLVKQYEGLFGMASLEVCRNAVRGIVSSVPKDQLPPLLVS